MSFIKNLLGLKTKPDVTSEQSVREHCPMCRSTKIAIQISSNDKDNDEAQRSRQSGGCIFINSGSLKRICQECTFVWGEQNFDTPACLMMKPKKQE